MTISPLPDAAAEVTDPIPLVVDIDAFFGIDVIVESVMSLVRESPRMLLHLPRWLARGRVGVGQGLAHERTSGDFRCDSPDLLAYLQDQKRQGRQLVLRASRGSGAPPAVVGDVGFLKALFRADGNSGSDDLVPECEAPLIKFGVRGYDYLGTCRGDSGVWGNARSVLPVAPSRALLRRLAARATVTRIFARRTGKLSDYLQSLRPLHWIKNLLLLVPIGAAHRLPDVKLAAELLLAWLAFSLCCSSIYLLNDLFDLQSDRRRPDTKERPLASGRIRPVVALISLTVLLLAAFALGSQLPLGFTGAMAAYYVLNCLYSIRWKQVPVLDVLALASGYVLRVVAGSYVVGITPSAWLIALCVFLFLSLALIKRYAELVLVQSSAPGDVPVRGYLTSDASLIASEGIASGYVAVLVLALYTNSPMAEQLYARHGLFWVICLLLLYWINYLWLMARRAKLPHDPVVFALKDRTSRWLIVAMGVTILCAL